MTGRAEASIWALLVPTMEEGSIAKGGDRAVRESAEETMRPRFGLGFFFLFFADIAISGTTAPPTTAARTVTAHALTHSPTAPPPLFSSNSRSGRSVPLSSTHRPP